MSPIAAPARISSTSVSAPPTPVGVCYGAGRVQHRPAQPVGGVCAAKVGPDVGGGEQIPGTGGVDRVLDGLAGKPHDVVAAEGDRAVGGERHDNRLRQPREHGTRCLHRRLPGQPERLALVDEEHTHTRQIRRRAAGIRPGIIVAAGHEGEGSGRDDVELVEARSNRLGRGRGHVGCRGAGAGVDRDHRPIAAERHHDRRRRARRRPGGDRPHTLVGQRRSHQISGHVFAERRRDRRGQAEPRGTHGRDRSPARRANHLSRELLFAERGQRLEPDEGQVEEHRGGDDELCHDRTRIARRLLMRRGPAPHRPTAPTSR